MTAVEWLVNQVNSDCLNSTFIQPKLIEQAKQMEKEKMQKMYNHAMLSLLDTGHGQGFEEYYNETYK